MQHNLKYDTHCQMCSSNLVACVPGRAYCVGHVHLAAAPLSCFHITLLNKRIALVTAAALGVVYTLRRSGLFIHASATHQPKIKNGAKQINI